MVAGSWLDNDGKFRQYGTSKAVAASGGDYLAWGDTREMEFTISLASLTSSPLVQEYTTFFPASNTQLFVEKVVIDVEVGAVGGTSISIGTGYMTPGTLTTPPAVTAISNTAFVNALVTASINTAGQQITMTNGTTSAGGYIGTTSADQTHKNYITALASGTYSAGQIKVRIFYRGLGSITQ
jgi:hypothetical protein